MLRFYNTASREKEDFVPLESGRVRMYSCGPTVHDYAHIGNFRAFLLADLIKRYLRFSGFEVVHVMNITDIDDKILRRINAAGQGLGEFTEQYAEVFFQDLRLLNIIPADEYPRATAHIPEMVDLISRLMERGLAYERDGSVYYSIAGFPAYGQFARLDPAGMKDGISVDRDEYGKEDVRDFALWKAWVESDGQVGWEAPFGKGRPGWHLECSCMSMKYLGESFDIHTGGVDLIFPHHQNEIAQSEGATGKPFVRYWVHNEFVNINAEKMSKSQGNFYRLKDIGKSAEDIRAYRYLVVTSHHRTVLNFTLETLESSKAALRRLTQLRDRLWQASGDGEAGEWQDMADATLAEFRMHMDDDLNTPRAIAAVFGLVNQAEKALNQGRMSSGGAGTVLGFLEKVDQVLGVFYEVASAEPARPAGLTPELERLLQERQRARLAKEWGRSDELRDQLAAAGVVVKDTRDGYEWTWA
ncbi:MAG: cysteine--tRNA ligase [Candidatus Latescibacteria bacterium]|nr:cysteine--tRNA ligase [Candidatus Latescibacterota bacterium]